MNQQELMKEAEELGKWRQHKFMLLVGATIVGSMILVVISMELYNTSGAAQLDLSRPGYQSVRGQADRSEDFDSFPSTGALTRQDVKKFRELYDKQVHEVTAIDSFGGDVMKDSNLSIEAPKSN